MPFFFILVLFFKEEENYATAYGKVSRPSGEGAPSLYGDQTVIPPLKSHRTKETDFSLFSNFIHSFLQYII